MFIWSVIYFLKTKTLDLTICFKDTSMVALQTLLDKNQLQLDATKSRCSKKSVGCLIISMLFIKQNTFA